MSTLMLYIGIAVTFLTVWGVVMVGGYLLGEGDADEPMSAKSNWGADVRTSHRGDLTP